MLYNKNFFKKYFKTKNIIFKVDKGGYYYLDLFAESYEKIYIRYNNYLQKKL